MLAKRFLIKGRVQGVGFRWYTRAQAKRLGLCGWVRNLADGSLEACAEGKKTALDSLESLLEIGPPGSVVQKIHTEIIPETGCFTSFRIIV